MGLGDERVGGVDDRGFGPALEQLIGMGHEVLVEGVFTGYQDDERLGRPSPGPPRLLAEGRDRSREGGQHSRIQTAYVDPQLECVGGDHASQFP